MELTAELTTLLWSIIGDRPEAQDDRTEVALLIHPLQRMILGQAAARAYPDRYRLLGPPRAT